MMNRGLELKQLKESYLEIVIRKVKETGLNEIILNYPVPYSYDSDGDPDMVIYSIKSDTEECGLDNGYDSDNFIKLNSLDLMTTAHVLDIIEAGEFKEYKDE